MMLDPLRVKNHLEPVRKFSFSTAVPFFRLWLIEASRSIIKLPISFFEFSQSDDSESDEIIFDWILLKTTVKKRFEKTFMVSTIRALLNSSSRTLFRLFFLFYHTSTMTRPFFFFVRECGNLSRTSSHCHPLCIWTIPKVDRLPSEEDVQGRPGICP